MKRFIRALLGAIAVSLLIAAPVLAIVFSAPFTITEAIGTDYDMFPARADTPIAWLVSRGYMDADALDTRVQTPGGANRPHMVSSAKVLTATALPANSQINLAFTTGRTPISSFDIITGYNGFITIPDDADLELGNTFEIEIDDAYFNTEAGGTKTIVLKDGVFETYVSAADTITARIIEGGNTSPTAHSDPSAVWQAEANMYDGNDGTLGETTAGIPATSWSGFMEFTHAALSCTGVRYKISTQAISAPLIDIDLWYSGGWQHMYNGSFTEAVPEYQYIGSTETVTKMRVAVYNNDGGAKKGYIWEMHFVEVSFTTVNATAVTGEHDLLVSADGANLEISVDGAVAGAGHDSQALAGATVADNANDWLIMDNSTTQFMPYMAIYEHTTNIGGYTLKAWYQPDDIVVDNVYDGTETAGGSDTIVTDNTMGEAPGYWVGARVTITDAGGAAPEGESRVCTVFAAGGVITVGTAFSANVDIGDDFTIEFGTLVDRQGGDEDARITWGVNPTGVVGLLGSMISADQPSLIPSVTTEARDIVRETEVSDWFEAPAITGALLTNPARPFVVMISDNTTLNEMQVWQWLGIALVIMVLGLCVKAIPRHLAIALIAGGVTIGVLAIMSIFPLWSLTIAILCGVGGLISERSRSL